jgi:C4-dicarboxylate-specific signal transduction histidine kinase
MKGYIVITGILAVIVLSLIALNVSFQRTLQIEMAEQFNKQQLLIAKTEATNIQSYLNVIKEDMLHVVQLAAMMNISKEKDFRVLTDSSCRHIGDIKRRVVFLDNQGKIRFTRGTMAIEETDDRIFSSAVKNGCQSDALIQQDSKRVYLTAPVCRSGSLTGALMVFIDIHDMSSMFLSSIKSGLRGYAWMMDEKGNLLYHPTQPDMVGRNLYKTDSSCFKCHKTFDVEKKIIEGKGDFHGKQVAPTGENKVLAFSTASVGDSKWIVAVSAPYTEVTMSIKKSMKYYSWLIIAIFLIMNVASVLLIFFYRNKTRSEELERHEKELEKYAGELEQKVSQRTWELTAEKEKLNTIVSAIGIGIMLVDNQEMILWINQTMQDIAGRDITGTHCRELFKDYFIISSSEEKDMQTAVLSNLFGKSDRCFQVTTAPVKADDGGVHGYIKLIQDVTELKRQEEQMVHSEKLACLGRLTSGIAYEIGNPLTSVFSFIQILKNMEKDEFKKETIETIYFHMKSIADILTQLSVFSKMPLMELRPSKVNSLIEESLSLIQYDKRTQDITIIKDLATDMPMITTDESQLSHVLVNMVLNAADAMPDGGTLTIRSRVKNNSIVIDFEDTGVGIDSDNLSRVFDPLFSTKEKGTGLGLAVSYRIIKKLNGSIKVESEPNKGSKFVITLPVYLTI